MYFTQVRYLENNFLCMRHIDSFTTMGGGISRFRAKMANLNYLATKCNSYK